MYNHIKGRLIEKSPTHVVIETGGIGYLLNISLNTFAKISDNENCGLLIHLSVKEDALSFFGFADEDERKLFRNLISVSGIGETTARMMLSSLSPNEIQQAIITGNTAVLQGIKGIGTKTAQRAIIDLKDKLVKGDSGFASVGTQPVQKSNVKEQALSALITLGFNKLSVEKVLSNTMQNKSGEISVEQLIKLALNQL